MVYEGVRHGKERLEKARDIVATVAKFARCEHPLLESARLGLDIAFKDGVNDKSASAACSSLIGISVAQLERTLKIEGEDRINHLPDIAPGVLKASVALYYNNGDDTMIVQTAATPIYPPTLERIKLAYAASKEGNDKPLNELLIDIVHETVHFYRFNKKGELYKAALAQHAADPIGKEMQETEEACATFVSTYMVLNDKAALLKEQRDVSNTAEIYDAIPELRLSNPGYLKGVKAAVPMVQLPDEEKEKVLRRVKNTFFSWEYTPDLDLIKELIRTSATPEVA